MITWIGLTNYIARDLSGKRHLALKDKIKKMHASFGSNLFWPKKGRDRARVKNCHRHMGSRMVCVWNRWTKRSLTIDCLRDRTIQQVTPKAQCLLHQLGKGNLGTAFHSFFPGELLSWKYSLQQAKGFLDMQQNCWLFIYLASSVCFTIQYGGNWTSLVIRRSEFKPQP